MRIGLLGLALLTAPTWLPSISIAPLSAQPAPSPTTSIPAQPPRHTTAPAPVMQEKPVPVPKPAIESSSTLWKCLTAISLGGFVVFFIMRIVSSKPKAQLVATEDQTAEVRRHVHRRGHGVAPASREEQRISKSSHQEFMQAPMRSTAPTREPRADQSSAS